MAQAGTMDPPRVGIPRIGVKVEVKVEKTGGGGGPDPEDRRPFWRRFLDGLKNLIKVRVR